MFDAPPPSRSSAAAAWPAPGSWRRGDRRQALEVLSRKLHDETEVRPRVVRAPLTTGWDLIDRSLGGGLARGAVHEWFGPLDASEQSAPPAPWRGRWAPPLLVLMHLAKQALAQMPDDVRGEARILWIGRKVWPYPNALAASGKQVLAQSVFVDPPDEKQRLWAIDLALRCPSVCAVVADGQGLSMGHSRRLLLAAESTGAFALLARPAFERAALSAATTRWQVRRLPGEADEISRPRFELELVRRKGTNAEAMNTEARSANAMLSRFRLDLTAWNERRWRVEWNREAGAVLELPDVVDRSRQAPDAAQHEIGRA